MKIGNLEQHCGECEVMEYCGEGFCYCLCEDPRFSELDEDEYNKIAESINWPDITQYSDCEGCTRPNCGVFRCSEGLYVDEVCDYRDEAVDHFCHQVADFVYKKLKGRNQREMDTC